MKTHYLKFLLLLVTSLFLGCKNHYTQKQIHLLGTWRLSAEEEITSNSHDIFSDVSGTVKVLSFFPDSSFTQFSDFGKLETGKWSVSKNQDLISFGDPGKLSASYHLEVAKNSGRETLIFEDPSLNKRLKFIKEFEPLTNYRNDPLYYSNNKWREKPISALADNEIKAKITNYVKHLALILNAAKERNQQVVSFEFSRGPIKIYNGGIGVHPFDKVPEQWKNCFYDESEAMKGYLTYESAVDKTDYRRAAAGNWIEDDFHILNAIYAVLSKP